MALEIVGSKERGRALESAGAGAPALPWGAALTSTSVPLSGRSGHLCGAKDLAAGELLSYQVPSLSLAVTCPENCGEADAVDSGASASMGLQTASTGHLGL